MATKSKGWSRAAGFAKKHRVGLGVGAAALAGAALGAYAFSGKHGAKNRKRVKVFAAKAKKEIARDLAKLEKVGAKEYRQAASRVVARYRKLKGVHPQEVALLAKELQGEWKRLEKQFAKAAKKLAKRAKKARI